jgi:DNA-binding transcriptional LysR family regulator
MSLGLQDLQDIQTICEAGSFRHAATRLGVTQPTLSKRVDRMESRLGTTLFDRARGRSRPTALALLIAERSAGLLATAASLVSEVQRIARSAGGTVRMGLGPAPVTSLLEKLIVRVREELPEISLVCRTGDTEKLMKQLDAREIDFALCPLDPALVRSHFLSEPLVQSEVVIVTSPDHGLIVKPPATIAELFRYAVAMPVLEPMYQGMALERFGIDLAQMEGVVYCSNFHVLMSLAATGEYVVLGPAFAFGKALTSGAVVATPLPVPIPHEVHLFTNRHGLPIPAVQSVLEILRGHIDDLIEIS